MAFGIALALDSDLSAQVAAVWRQFEAAGVGKTPGEFEEPPHITLALFPSGDPMRLARLLDETPFSDTSLALTPFGAFLGDRHVLYYNVVLCPALLEAHAALHARIRAENLPCDPLYSPGSIVFHCSLAMEVEPQALSSGVEICLRNPQTRSGRAEAVELFEYFPVKSLHRRRLSCVRASGYPN